MKIKIKTILTFFLIGVTMSACKEKAPNLILSKYTCDLGQVYEGNIIDGNVTVYNKGDRTLFINDLYPDCNCIKVEINKREIAKNDSAIVHFSINTARKSEETENIVTLQANTDSVIHFFTINAFVINPNDNDL
ncbi:MAG: DUF1573 domain-containing protein [Bacteroides sp.]|nr:DUF1573 domain-containing protein [Bacteroides sp.]